MLGNVGFRRERGPYVLGGGFGGSMSTYHDFRSLSGACFLDSSQIMIPYRNYGLQISSRIGFLCAMTSVGPLTTQDAISHSLKLIERGMCAEQKKNRISASPEMVPPTKPSSETRMPSSAT